MADETKDKRHSMSMAKRGHKERKSKEERATDVCLFFFLQFGNKTNIEIINKIVVKNFYIFVRVRSFLNLWFKGICLEFYSRCTVQGRCN